MRLLLLLICFLCIKTAEAQHNSRDKMLLNKFDLYKASRAQGHLFLHTDKNIYTPNEKIWFSVYLMKVPEKVLNKIEFLQVSLVDLTHRKIFLQSKFPMANGMSAGDFSIPDSIPPGNYHLLAMSNLVDSANVPLYHFDQVITIKRPPIDNLRPKLTWDPTNLAEKENLRAFLDLDYQPSKNVKAPVLEYLLDDGTQKKIDWKGSRTTIDVNYASLSIQGFLNIKISHGGAIQFIQLPLPNIKGNSELSIKFYPEGGYILKGGSGMVAWEALENGMPVQVSATLIDNDVVREDLETNSYGAGKFHLKQLPGHNYVLKIKRGKSRPDTLINIPDLSLGIAGIELKRAVVNDSLQLRLFSVLKDTLQVVIHNYNDIFSTFRINTNQHGRNVKLDLKGVPKGIGAITILDSNGIPLAERLFFAHFNDRVETNLRTDKAFYSSNDHIRIDLSLKDKNKKPLQGIFSASVVQLDRLNFFVLEDIESYIFLKSTLASLPVHASGRGIVDENFVEDVLLTKGWRNYTWQELQKIVPNEVLQSRPLSIEGRVLKKGKVLTEPVQLLFNSVGKFQTLQTDDTGRFVASPQLSLNNDDRGVSISVAEKNKDDYQIQLYDSLSIILENFIKNHRIRKNLRHYKIDSSQFAPLKTEGIIMLESVTIKGNVQDFSLQGGKVPGVNACGDYVDEFGYLNYPRSAGRPGLYQPVIGKQYQRRIDKDDDGYQFTVEPVTYTGCQDEKSIYFRFPGIKLEKRFYGPDPKIDDLNYQSTLFWKSRILTDQMGTASFDFFSGKLKGRFIVTVQGLTEENILYGTTEFEVR